MNNCLIIAGERSGEEHCLEFFNSLKDQLPDIKFWGIGGDKLKNSGMEIIYDMKDLSAMGITSITHLIDMFKVLRYIEKLVIQRNCKVAILIDFQEFNYTLAKRISKLGVNIIYYVIPQVWIWRSYRAYVLDRIVHTLVCILPFEKKWLLKRGINKAIQIHHPLWKKYKDKLDNSILGIQYKSFDNLQRQVRILLLPGSRNKEVIYMLPKFIESISNLSNQFNFNISIITTTSVDNELYTPYLSVIDKVCTDNELEFAMKEADICLATSGTITLASALFQLPTIVCYQTNILNRFIFYELIKYKGFVSIINIIHNKQVFKEYLLDKFSVFNITNELKRLLTDRDYYNSIKNILEKNDEIFNIEELDIDNYIGKVIKNSYEKNNI